MESKNATLKECLFGKLNYIEDELRNLKGLSDLFDIMGTAAEFDHDAYFTDDMFYSLSTVSRDIIKTTNAALEDAFTLLGNLE